MKQDTKGSRARTRPLALAAAGALAAGMLWSSAGDAAPKWVRVSIVDDPAHSMAVAWHTTTATQSNVRYGTDTAALTQTATGTVNQLPGELDFMHEAEMTNLQPGLRYYYQVGEDIDGWSEVLSFKTAPPIDENCGTLRFVYLGDNRPDSLLGMGDYWTSIFAEAVFKDPHFVLNGGDLVYSGDELGEWKDFLNWTGVAGAYVPMMPSMGNHDDDSVTGDDATYNRLFVLPRSSGTGSSGTEDYYYFTAGNVLVVSLNTANFTGGATPFADQAAWLDEVLTNNPKMWKFVMMHHPIYTQNTFQGHEPNEVNQNAAFVEVIDRHHVDIVFQSHNHWYERFDPSNCGVIGNPGSDSPCPVGPAGFADGTVYLTSGGAGAITIPFCIGGYPGRAKCDNRHHYVVFDIVDSELHMQAWASTQQQFGQDPANAQVIDEIHISKPAVTCAPVVPDAGVGGSGGAPSDGGVGGSGGVGTGGSGLADSGGSGGQLPDGGAGAPVGTGGQAALPPIGSQDDGGCSCEQAGQGASPSPWVWGILAGFLGAGLLTALRIRSRAREFQSRRSSGSVR